MEVSRRVAVAASLLVVLVAAHASAQTLSAPRPTTTFRLHVTSARRHARLYLLSGPGVTTPQGAVDAAGGIDSLGQLFAGQRDASALGFVAACSAPCDLRLAPGRYEVAVGESDTTPKRADHELVVRGDAHIVVEHDDRRDARLVGWAFAEAGLLFSIVTLAVIPALAGAGDAGILGELTLSGFDLVLVIVALALVLTGDHSDVRGG